MTERIKLLRTLDVDRRHGCRVGRIFETMEPERPRHPKACIRWYIRGDAGEAVGVMKGEAEVVKGSE